VRLRLVGYNVQELRGGVGEAAAVLQPLAADLVLLQECGTRRRLGRLVDALEMEVASSHRLFRLVHNAVLFDPAWRLVGYEVRDFTREGRTRRRGLVAATLRRSGIRLTAVAAHLGLSSKERRMHARELTDFLGGLQGFVVMGIDLNEGPEAMASRWIAERMFDAFAMAGRNDGETFPSSVPTARIDYLFVGDGVTVRRCGVPADEGLARVSDHRPVVADVEVAGD
jgi:endonuclease/exonuclease/phosphatase family metal-dependent hydrolase